MDISRRESLHALELYLGSNAKVAETQVDEIFFIGIKVELVIMDKCWHQTRGKVFGRKLMWVGKYCKQYIYRLGKSF